MGSYQQADRGRIFRSTDGTDLTFIADSDVIDEQTNGPTPGTLITRDGTKYRFGPDSYVTQIEDRNGNLIQYSFQGTANGGIYTATDPAGRTESINFTEDFATDLQDVLTYPGFNGGSHPVQINYALLQNSLSAGESLKTYKCLFPELSGSSTTSYNSYVVSSIVLPDGTSYSMQYNAYGELTRLTLPTGGVYTYRYAEASGCAAGTGSGVVAFSDGSGYRIYRRVLERDEYSNGTQLSAKILFSATPAAGIDPNHSSRAGTIAEVDYQDASGNLLRQEKHDFYGDPSSAQPPSADQTQYAAWWLSQEFQTQIGNGSATLQTQQRVFQQRPCAPGEHCWFDPQADTSPSHDLQLCQINTILDNGRTSGIVLDYDQYNNLTDKYEFDYNAAPAVGASCPASTSGYTRHTNAQYAGSPYTATSTNILGLPVLTTVDAGGAVAAETRYGYDETSVSNAPNVIGHDNANYAGNATRGNQTTVSQCLNPQNCVWISTTYGYDIAGNLVSTTDPLNHTTLYSYADAQNSYAHVTQTTNPAQQTTAADYNYSSGKPILTSDLNGVNTTYAYNDPLDRLTDVHRAAGGGPVLESQTHYSYSSTSVYRDQDQNTTGDRSLETGTIYDGLGRQTTQIQFNGNSYAFLVTQEYDALGRITVVGNPEQAPNQRPGYTSTSYDALGRVTAVQTADGATTTTSYSGNTAISTDPAGKRRELITDALGRLTIVYEDPGGLNYLTAYNYDALDDLTSVSKRTGIRTISQYDSLKRVTQVTNGESGTVNYTYDNAGNLVQRTDNRNVVTTYGYDALNRLTGKTYSDGTPTVGYAYDGNVAYGKGHLTWVSDGYSSTSYNSFDALGRVTASQQTNLGQTYTFAYSYNLADALTSETYPSGRTIATSYDKADRTVQVTGTLNGQQTNYVSGVTYAPQGSPTLYAYGNNLYRSFAYNNRLQISSIQDAANNSGGSVLFGLNLNWGTSNNSGSLQGLTQNNGGPGYPQFLTFHQSFSYDGANRLASANDDGGWSRAYAYDDNGNMWLTGASGVSANGMPTSNVYNRQNRVSSGSYDASGNQTVFGTYTLAYDAENRQISATESPAMGGGQIRYYYDGLGQRVDKNDSTIYVYDAFGNLAAEYDSGSTQAASCTTCYLSRDQLGSVRLITDQNANVIARHDFLPFGEEVPANTVGRNGQWGSGNDNIAQKFTGQERDGETGNDFFQARYLSSAQGRFLSPDPENAGADLYNPQSWNEYAYVSNNPLNAIDPTGTTTCDANGDNCQDTVNVQGGSPDPIPLDLGSTPIGIIGSNSEPPLRLSPPPPPPPLRSVGPISSGNGNNNCVAGFAAAGAGVVGGVGAQVGFTIGAVAGTLVEPGGGTILGGVGGVGGAALVGGLGTYYGGKLGTAVGNVVRSSSSGTGGGGRDTTNHGERRISQRKFSPEEIVNTKTGDRFEQADGAIAYVKKVGRNSYNVLIENPDGQVVTGIKNLSRQEVGNLATNYGWR